MQTNSSESIEIVTQQFGDLQRNSQQNQSANFWLKICCLCSMLMCLICVGYVIFNSLNYKSVEMVNKTTTEPPIFPPTITEPPIFPPTTTERPILPPMPTERSILPPMPTTVRTTTTKNPNDWVFISPKQNSK